jgi:CubicO group peptidase (beta-lactamase class C family)
VKPPVAKHAPAAAPDISTKATSAPVAPALTQEDLSAFLDGFMPQQIEQADIAGAVVAVVKDGHLLFSRGYGYSDYEKKVRCRPKIPFFRPAHPALHLTRDAARRIRQTVPDRDVNDIWI